MLDSQVTEAINGLYDATVSPDTWAHALQAFAKSLGAEGCLFYPKDPTATALSLPVSQNIEEFIETFVRDRWYLHDPRGTKGWPLIEAGRTVILEDDLTTTEERDGSDCYRELYRPWRMTGWAAVGFTVEGRRWCMPILRTDRQGPFTKDDGRRLALAAPHLRSIVSLAEKIARSRGEAKLELLERFECAGFLLDVLGHVTRMNAPAEQLLGSGLHLNQRRLSASDDASNTSLQRLIASALGLPDCGRGDPVCINRNGTAPLVAEAIPVLGAIRDLSFGARVLLVLKAIEPPRDPNARLIELVFGITPAEAKLAARIAAGDSIDEISAARGISRETARNRLKSVFAKTGTHRQGELVALLASLPRQPPHDPG